MIFRSFITIDVEEDLGTKSREKTYYGITQGLPVFFDVLDELNAKATFFFTVETAQAFPELFKEVNKKHEIACHGYYHKEITEFDMRTNRQYLLRGIKVLQKLAGHRPHGFRAVNFKIGTNFIKLLEELGFTYDSSVIPAYPALKVYTKYKGQAPQRPYHPKVTDHRKKGNYKILEMPISVIPIINFPWSGTWIRVFGKSLYKSSILLFKSSYILLALHSWDFINLKGRTLYSRNSGKTFANMLRDLLFFFYDKDYSFFTLIEGSKANG